MATYFTKTSWTPGAKALSIVEFLKFANKVRARDRKYVSKAVPDRSTLAHTVACGYSRWRA